ncbi:MAG: LytTR family transcriptional regulator DNA-binding domain-containing protein [Oscillospiraceae bacterium]|nr:LytTR family transcriptional regulator DNA-binding domain-containing protein [Oscillospiraceae bacterium]
MKITININENIQDTEIVINCARLTPETESIIAALHIMDSQLTVIKDEGSYILDISEIAYIETVDRKTFVYTENECYESRLKLYEMEDRLCGMGFMRVSKSCIVRLRYIRSLKAELDRKLRLTLENGEQLIVSRQYADELKKRLGVKQ